MRILTLNNTAFDLNELPEDVEEDTRFSVLDNSTPSDPDFFFIPLIFLESFNAPAIVLRVGGHEVQMPLDWSMVVAMYMLINPIPSWKPLVKICFRKGFMTGCMPGNVSMISFSNPSHADSMAFLIIFSASACDVMNDIMMVC
jgi:hypothetical protein